MEIIAHRGASAYAPENTLSAMAMALKMGAKAIETDVHLSLDGQFVICHDDKIETPSRDPFYLRKKTLAEIQKIALPGGETIPTLEEVLDLIHSRAKVYLEIKAMGVAEKLGPWLKERPGHHVAITSFLPGEIEWFNRHFPEVPTSIVTTALPRDLNNLFQGLHTKECSLSRGFAFEPEIKRAKEFGCTLRVYTVNNAQEALTYLGWGVDAIFTDRPDLLKDQAS